MVDALAARPAGFENWKAPQTVAPRRLSGEHVAFRVTGESGLTRIKLDKSAFLGRPAPELRTGSGIRQAGPGIGDARPIAPEPLVEATPVFTAPLGEVRI